MKSEVGERKTDRQKNLLSVGFFFLINFYEFFTVANDPVC